jgi:hypothetical protein
MLLAAVSCAVAGAIAFDAIADAKTNGGTATASKATATPKPAKAAKAAAPRPTMAQVYRAADRVTRATLEVINDVGQRRMAFFTNDPRDWTPTTAQVDKDASLWKGELAQLGPLEPPKKSWLDSDMKTLQRAVDLVNNEVESLPATEQTGQSWTDLTAAVSKMNASMKLLTPLTAGPPYDNLKIAEQTLAVRDAAKAIIDATRGEKK